MSVVKSSANFVNVFSSQRLPRRRTTRPNATASEVQLMDAADGHSACGDVSWIRRFTRRVASLESLQTGNETRTMMLLAIIN